MPLKSADLLSCKDGLVQLTLEIEAPDRDDPDQLAEAVRSRVADHQTEIMSDPAVLEPYSLGVASTIVSRDTIPEPIRARLAQLGFESIAGAEGGAAPRSLFARFERARRNRPRLDQWRSVYLRAADVSGSLGSIEAALYASMPAGDLPEIADEATALTIEAAAKVGLVLSADTGGLGALERAILRVRSRQKGRLVLHPTAVRAFAAFTGACIQAVCRDTAWAPDDDDAPLHVQTDGGVTVRTDPEHRVVSFVLHGRKALLTDYAEAVRLQSLTGTVHA